MTVSPDEGRSAPAGPPQLERSIGPWQMALYGLGSMLGAGIYGLIGKAAGQVGNAVWLAFLVAFVAALLTGLSYASLGSRYPRAGGAAYITHRAFSWPLLSFTVGLALVCSGLTSVATQSRVFAANLATLFGLDSLPLSVLAIGFLLLLAGIVFRGIKESMWVNVVCTLVEAAGLIIVIAVGVSYWGDVNYMETPQVPGADTQWLLVLQGAILTFFAFIGYEDTLNVAEEVKDPGRNVPLGIILAMSAAAVIYVAVAITAVSVVPWQELAEAPGPITEVVSRAAPLLPPILFTAITLFAVANTALVNFVTASRLVFGMARQGLLPEGLSKIHMQRRTPHVAILTLFIIVVPLALVGTISDLAAATVLLLLTIFAVVNAALLVLQRRKGEPKGRFEVPAIIPALGLVTCFILVAVRVTTGDLRAPVVAGALLLGIVGLYVILRPQAVPAEEMPEPEA